MLVDLSSLAFRSALKGYLDNLDTPAGVSYLGFSDEDNHMKFYFEITSPAGFLYESRFIFQLLDKFMTTALIIPAFRQSELWAFVGMNVEEDDEGKTFLEITLRRDLRP